MNEQQAPKYAVYLTKGRFHGVPTWHYIKVDLLKLPLLKQALKSGMVDLSRFGEILYSGWGAHPPEHVRHKIDATYK